MNKRLLSNRCYMMLYRLENRPQMQFSCIPRALNLQAKPAHCVISDNSVDKAGVGVFLSTQHLYA